MKFLKIEASGEFKIVKLNRPEVKNAFHPEMIAEITAVFTEFNTDSKIKAVVIAGEGSVFCAGADLNWMQEMIKYSLAENQKDSEKLWQMFEAIQVCERPVIGIVHGAVFGGALGLMSCCDYVFAEEKTQFCFSEVKLGLVPAVISSFVLKKVPDAFVRPLMLSAEVFNSEKGKAIGLVHATFSGAAVIENCVKTFENNGLEAMNETKKLLNQLPTLDWAGQMKKTTQVISERRVSAEGQSRLQKFISKK